MLLGTLSFLSPSPGWDPKWEEIESSAGKRRVSLGFDFVVVRYTSVHDRLQIAASLLSTEVAVREISLPSQASYMLDVACLLSDMEADRDIMEKSAAWQVEQRVTLRRSTAAQDHGKRGKN